MTPTVHPQIDSSPNHRTCVPTMSHSDSYGHGSTASLVAAPLARLPPLEALATRGTSVLVPPANSSAYTSATLLPMLNSWLFGTRAPRA